MIRLSQNLFDPHTMASNMPINSAVFSNNSNSSARRKEEDVPTDLKAKLSPDDIVDLIAAQVKFEALKKQRREAKKSEDMQMKDAGIDVTDMEKPKA